MKKLLNNLVFLGIIVGFVVGIHAGIIYGKPQYVHWTFKSNAKELERITYSKLERFKAKIIKQMKADGVPVDYKDLNKHLKVQMDDKGIMRAEVIWSVHVDYYGFFPRDFNYKVEISR